MKRIIPALTLALLTFAVSSIVPGNSNKMAAPAIASAITYSDGESNQSAVGEAQPRSDEPAEITSLDKTEPEPGMRAAAVE